MDETLVPADHGDCREFSESLGHILDKWTVPVVVALRDGTLRFNEIKRALAGISQDMLTRALKNLERDGMVLRTVHPTVPPTVEYALTPLGHSLFEGVGLLIQWATSNLTDIHRNRAIYDARSYRGMQQ